MNTPSSTLDQNLAASISDRAFRLYCVIVLRGNGGWMNIPDLAAACNLTHHEARGPVTELCTAGLVEKDRRKERGSTGRKTNRTYLRLTETAAAEAAA